MLLPGWYLGALWYLTGPLLNGCHSCVHADACFSDDGDDDGDGGYDDDGVDDCYILRVPYWVVGVSIFVRCSLGGHQIG